MKTLMEPLKELSEFQKIQEAVEQGKTPVQMTGCLDSAKGQMIHGLASDFRYRLIVTVNELRAKELYEAGVYVNSSLPPAAAPHECLLRTSLMATHTTELIDEAVGIMKDILRRHEL